MVVVKDNFDASNKETIESYRSGGMTATHRMIPHRLVCIRRAKQWKRTAVSRHCSLLFEYMDGLTTEITLTNLESTRTPCVAPIHITAVFLTKILCAHSHWFAWMVQPMDRWSHLFLDIQRWQWPLTLQSRCYQLHMYLNLWKRKTGQRVLVLVL